MNPFNELRTSARQIRDTAIARARADYEKRMEQIHEIEMSLKSRTPGNRAVRASVESVIPNGEFTMIDVLTALEARDPTRIWTRKSVEHSIFRMRHRGLIKRVSKRGDNRLAIYCRVDVPANRRTFDDMTFIESVAAVLATDGPLSATELVVTLLERGYRTMSSRKILRSEVTTLMNKNPDRFTKDGQRWTSK